MWQKARDAEAAAAAAASVAAASAPTTTTTATRGRGRGRGGAKRKATDQPDGQSTPKRSTRNTEDPSQLLSALALPPAPAKGLLASAAEADLPPEGTPAEEESPSGSPEPANLFSGAASSASQTRLQGKIPAREKSPPLPKNITEADEFGTRSYNQRASLRDRALTTRLLAPQCVEWGDFDIGFRDSVNDPTKGHTHAKRGKYLNTPNSNGFHYDQWIASVDYSATKPSDFNKETVKRYNVHPSYGIFLPNSNNAHEDQHPMVIPGKPIVFIANPSGRVSHASRSYQQTVNHNRLADAPWRHKLGASLRRFCKVDDETDLQDIDITDSIASDEELRQRSLGTALLELEARPSASGAPSELETETAGESDEALASRDALEGARPDLSAFLEAAAHIEALETPRETPRATPAPAKPVNAQKYDAVRDLFVSTAEPPTPVAQPASLPPIQQEASGLSFLADLCAREPVLAPSRQDEVVDAFVRPALPPPSSVHDYEQAPMSSERETSYLPPTPTQSIRDFLHEPEPPLQAAPPRAPSLPPPQPLHHHVREEPTAYLPPSRQSTLPPVHDYATSRDYAPAAPPPPMVQAPALPPDYPPSQQHHYAPPPLENGYAPPPHNGYPVPEMQPHSQQPPRGHPYDHSLSHRPMSSFAPSEPSYARPSWPQHPPPPPPGPPSLAPAPAHDYPPPPPPPITTPRSSFSHLGGELLPALRPSRGRPSSVYDESMVDPSLRSGPPGPPPPPNSYSNYYPSPAHGYSHAYGPPEPQHQPYQHRPSDRMLPNPQQQPPPHHHPGYMTSPPPPAHAYHSSIASPTMGTMQLGGQGLVQSPQEPPPHHAFRHRSTGSGSGLPPPPPPGDANSKYRKLQPAPIPAHRSWSNNKPELKTIPYDHKDSTGSSGAAALPNSGPTTIRGWNVNPQRRRPRSDRRDTMDGGNERDDAR